MKKVQNIGICKLCQNQRELRESHYMPAALYPARKELTYATRSGVGKVQEQMKAYLLCSECEQRFDRNGETEVLRHLAPKANQSPLHRVLRFAAPREWDETLARFAGYEVGVDMDKFGYFAMSIVWRAAVHDWTLPDGNLVPRIPLGDFEPPIRKYLLEQAPLPPDTVVLVIVCSDNDARRIWSTPQTTVEARCLNFRFLVRGVFFRVMMGDQIHPWFREYCCTSPRKCLLYGDASHRMPEILQMFERAANNAT